MPNIYPSSFPALSSIKNPRPSSIICPVSLESITSNCLNPNLSSLYSAKFPKPRNFSFKCSFSDYYGLRQQQQQRSPKNGSGVGVPPKVFVGHSIYKGKAVLTVDPKAPEFAPLDSGAFKIAKEGAVFLQFAPAADTGRYDWGRKQVFSLSVAEVGTLISLGPKETCEFFHFPFKGKSDEGKVRKVLKVEPLSDGSGHLFNLNVLNKLTNLEENIYIPITRGEYAVLVSAFNFILPYLLGWHAFADSVNPEDTGRVNNANPRSGAENEWSM